MTISMDTFKEEINRAFRVLGADKGFGQNVTDIQAWKESGFLSNDDYHELRQYNREQYHALP